MTRDIFGCVPQELHLGVDVPHPVVLLLLVLALQAHHQAAGLLPLAGGLVLDVLQLVHLEGGVVLGDDISYSDLVHAERSLLITRLAAHSR